MHGAAPPSAPACRKLGASASVKLPLPQYSSSRSWPEEPAVAERAQDSIWRHMPALGWLKEASTCSVPAHLARRGQAPPLGSAGRQAHASAPGFLCRGRAPRPGTRRAGAVATPHSSERPRK